MLFSVLIPAFNAETTIACAINSALGQTVLGNVEILVYDDGSTDRTVTVTKNYAHDHPQVRVLQAVRNGGVSRARNILLDEARGDWLAFLDSDDVFLPHKLAACLQIATDHNSDFVTHDLGYLKGDGRVIGHIRNVGFAQASVLRKELTVGLRFSETLSAGEDTQFFCLLKRKAKHIHFSSVLTGLRIRQGSLTDKFWFEKRLIELWHFTHPDLPPPNNIDGYIEFYQSLSATERLNYHRKWLGQKFGRSAAGAMLAGNRLSAMPYFLASLLLNPSYVISRMRSNL
jgi:glycosyltransferase involved in cell wall biosynthesis